jgi:hypothetical protein
MKRIFVLALVWWVALAEPASAHTVVELRPTNLRTTVVSVNPPVRGLEVKSLELGQRLELQWSGPGDVVVMGYMGEPYLRVGPAGVFENLRSHTTYSNQPSSSHRRPPPDASPVAPPRWSRVSAGRTARWHDHRTHWVLRQPPEWVRRDPGHPHVVMTWAIPMQVGGGQVGVSGRVMWVPPPPALPWVGLAVALFVLATASALSRVWGPTLAAGAAILVGVDVFHSVGTATFSAVSLPVMAGRLLLLGWLSVLGWLAGLWALRRRNRGRRDGVIGAGLCALIVGTFGGVLDLGVLARSQVPFRWPAGAERAGVAVSVGLGAGILAAAFIALVRDPTRTETPPRPQEIGDAGVALLGGTREQAEAEPAGVPAAVA